MADNVTTESLDWRKDMTFEGVDAPFNHDNEGWALANLPKIRIASRLLRDDDKEMTARFAELAKTGALPEMLEGMAATRDHLSAIVDLLDTALSRSFIVLERLGYSPDMPPPDQPVN